MYISILMMNMPHTTVLSQLPFIIFIIVSMLLILTFLISYITVSFMVSSFLWFGNGPFFKMKSYMSSNIQTE